MCRLRQQHRQQRLGFSLFLLHRIPSLLLHLFHSETIQRREKGSRRRLLHYNTLLLPYSSTALLESPGCPGSTGYSLTTPNCNAKWASLATWRKREAVGMCACGGGDYGATFFTAGHSSRENKLISDLSSTRRVSATSNRMPST